ncbi:MAG: fumarylacetoacetate hydrolase family protein, partial [Pseudomonadota bacterium]
MAEYKLGTGLVGGASRPLVQVSGATYLLSDLLGDNAASTLEAVFADWDVYDTKISEIAASVDAAQLKPDDFRLLTPLSNPRKVVCIGTNYHDHLREMKVTKLPDFPYAFMRPQTCLAAHHEEIRLPSIPKMIDWEAELGIIIGSQFGPNDSGDPTSAIAGYTVLNDLSARDWIHDRPFVGIDWVMQKSWDQFQPTGPWITPARFVEDPGKLDIELSLKGVTKQKSHTSELIFGVQAIMEHLCGMMTLEPGDIIATG